MFTVKIYDFGTMDYTAYAARSYRKEFAGYTGPGAPPDNAAGPTIRGSAVHRLIMDVGKEHEVIATVEGIAYIENSEGKTIDTIRA